MGSIIVKTIKGRKYLYFVHYVDKKKIEKYCGPALKSESQKKVTQLAIEVLKKQKRVLTARIHKLEKRKFK